METVVREGGADVLGARCSGPVARKHLQALLEGKNPWFTNSHLQGRSMCLFGLFLLFLTFFVLMGVYFI